MRALAPVSAVAISLAASPAAAHGGGLAAWNFEPIFVAPLALSLALFIAGWLRLRGRAERGGGRLDRRGALFVAGWLTLAGATLSPLHHAGARSFAAHMLEHELLMLVAAPLIVLARPLGVLLWGLPSPLRQMVGQIGRSLFPPRLWAGLTEPVTATTLQAAALWLWHIPALFDRALASSGWHIAQHLSFLVTALLFWTAVLPRRARHAGIAVLCLFATSVVSGALGALMAFAHSPWYAAYAALGLSPYGLSPMEDQQLAGLLMWVPGGLVHAGAALAALARLLRPTTNLDVQHGQSA